MNTFPSCTLLRGNGLPILFYSRIDSPQADKTVLSRGDTKRTGSTASIALLQTLDTPSVPYFYASNVAITIAHCGDTRILLCKKEDGKVEPMTEKHHAESRVEAARLRRLGQALITDSFGETRCVAGSLMLRDELSEMLMASQFQ